MFDHTEIRYHFPSEVNLHCDEPVILERLQWGTSEFIQSGFVPNNARDIVSIQAFVRNVALESGGEAWRAVTQRGEVLCAYTVNCLAKEMSGAPVITLQPHDQYCLTLACARMRVPVA